MKISRSSLGALCKTVYSGGTPKSSNEEYYGGEIPWLRTQEVVFEKISYTDIKITESGLKNSSAKWVPENSVIVAMYGNSAGRSAISKIPLTTNQACCNLVIDENKADYRYVFYALKDNYKSLKLRSRGAAQNNLNASQVKDFEINLHEIGKQNAIGDILSAYDDLIENNRRRIQLLEETARLLYKEWFVHLRFPGHEHVEINDGVPDGWESGAIIDFYKTTSGGTPSRKNMDFYTGDINWVKTGELVDSFIFTTGEKITEEAIARSSAKIFPKGSVLVAMYGATIGRTGILAEPSASNQACCALIPNSDLSNTIHAYLFLRENKAGLINLAKGAAQNNISQNIIKSYPMVMPPAFLMEIFHSTLIDSFEQLKILQQQNVKLVEARDILLPRLMNGELTV